MKRLTYAMIGGAAGSFIGPIHRMAIRMDDLADLAAGCFSRDAKANAAAAETCGLPSDRVYTSWQDLLAAEKGRDRELQLYTNVEKVGKELLMERRNKEALSTNIDFYSGFVYDMLGLPMELYTPLFAVARIAGWSAHRMEELTSGGKLIRPRYECVEEHRSYTPIEHR